MNLSKYGLLLGLLTIIFVSSLIGGHFGYTVHGVPSGATTTNSTDLGQPSWIWQSIGFLGTMLTFQIDNMPVFVNVIFWIMSILSVVLIVSLIRGTE